LRECGRRVLVADEKPLIRAGNAQPNPARQRRQRRRRERAAQSVLLVETARRLKDREGVGDVERKDRDRIERSAGRDDAGRREHAPRSRRVGAKRKRNEAGADGGRRARARSSGYEICALRVARNAVGRTNANEAGRKLVEIRLADNDRARAFEPLDDERRLFGAIGEGGTGRRRRKPGCVDVVLDDKRDAIEGLALGT
jgi:hypothetical protein